MKWNSNKRNETMKVFPSYQYYFSLFLMRNRCKTNSKNKFISAFSKAGNRKF